MRFVPCSRINSDGDAARGIAARLDLAAIGVADAHEGGGAVPARRLDHDHLVAADAQMPVGDGARARVVERDRLAARASSTTKSLPSPCILMNGAPPMAPYIGAAFRPVQPRPSLSRRAAMGG